MVNKRWKKSSATKNILEDLTMFPVSYKQIEESDKDEKVETPEAMRNIIYSN